MVSKDFFFYKILNIHCHIENDMYLAVISTDHRDRLVFYIFTLYFATTCITRPRPWYLATNSIMNLSKTTVFPCFSHLKMFYHNAADGVNVKRQDWSSAAKTYCYSNQHIGYLLWRRGTCLIKGHGLRWDHFSCYWLSSLDPAQGDHLCMATTFVRHHRWSP